MPTLNEDLQRLLEERGAPLSLDAVQGVETQRAEAFRAMPITDRSTEAPFAGANRVNEGARLRGSNTVATIGPKGETIITGSGATPSQEVSETSTNFTSLAASIKAEKDPRKMLDALVNFKGSVDSHIANVTKSAINAAEASVGLKKLEADLTESIRTDKIDPLYAANNFTDSMMTKELRSQLQQAKVESRVLANQTIETNAELQGLKGASQLFISKTAQEAASLMNKQDTAEMRKQALLDNTRTNVMNVAPILYPELRGKDEVSIAGFMAKNADKETLLIAENLDNPTALLQLTTAGSIKAAKVASHLQASAISGATSGIAYEIARQESASDLEKLAFYSKPEKLKETIEASLGKGDAATKAFSDISAQAMALPKAEKADFLGRQAAAYALESLAMAKRNKFYGSVASWNPVDFESIKASPILAPLYNNVLKIKGEDSAITFNDLLNQIVQLPVGGNQLSNAKNELALFAKSALEKQNRGIYGKLGDTISIDTRINTAIAKSILESRAIGAGLQFTAGEIR